MKYILDSTLWNWTGIKGLFSRVFFLLQWPSWQKGFLKVSFINEEALEFSKMFSINYSEMNKLTEEHYSLNQMKNALLNKYWNRKEEREMELMGNDAKKN